MKKLICLFLILSLIVCVFVSCVKPSDGDPSSSKLGDYEVVIDSYRLAESDEGKPVIIVKYIFTNNSEDAQSFFWSLDTRAFQKGVRLSTCYDVSDSANYADENQSKEIKDGATLEVEFAYVLDDVESDVEIEVEASFSFSDKVIKKTFKIK